MKRTLFISMLLCLFAIVANAQNIKGYYSCGSIVNRNLQANPDKAQTKTDFGVPGGNTLVINITSPSGPCTFTFDQGNSNCYVLQTYDHMIAIAVPTTSWPGSEYCIITVECDGEYMEIKPYIMDSNYHP